MYEELFWEMVIALGQGLPVFLMLVIILDWCRSILFYNR